MRMIYVCVPFIRRAGCPFTISIIRRLSAHPISEDAEQFNIGFTYGTTNNELLQQFTLMADAYHNRVRTRSLPISRNLHQWLW